MPKSKDPKLARAGVSGYNKPKRTPNHPTKKFVVVAKEGDKTKTIRFGDAKMTIKKDQPKRRKSFRARHKCDTNPPANSRRGTGLVKSGKTAVRLKHVVMTLGEHNAKTISSSNAAVVTGISRH